RGGADRGRPVDRSVLWVRAVRAGHLRAAASGAVVGGTHLGGGAACPGDRSDRTAGGATGVLAGPGAVAAAAAGLRRGGQYPRCPGRGAGHDPGRAGRLGCTALAGGRRCSVAPGLLVRRVDRHRGHHPGGTARCDRGVARGRWGVRGAGGRCGAGVATAGSRPGAERGGRGAAYSNVSGPWQAIGVASPRRRSAGPTWQDVPLAPVVLVRGGEPLLADRTLQRLAGL